MKLNPIAKELWLKKLRDPQYQQCVGLYYNKKTNCYCATGLLILAYCEENRKTIDVSYIPYYHAFSWAIGEQFDSEKHDIFKPIIALNDITGASFSEIADYVEANC